MESDEKPAAQWSIHDSDQDGIIISEDSLRKLSKSLTKIIPKDGHKFDGAELR